MTSAERQRKYKAKMRENGLVQVSEWVPTERVNDIKELCSDLREEAAMIDSEVPAAL